MPTAHVNGLDIYHEQAGSGPPLLFISGTGGDLRNKPNQFDGPFPKAFDMVSYDQRGLGRSAKPDVAYTMADYADDASALMGELGIEKAHVIGVSFGGMVAQELALRHPLRVKRLVLACTSPGGEGGASFPFHEIDHLKGVDRARHMIPISDTRRDAAWAAANPELHAQFVEMGAADP
jgi:3-oxoadipate enol-lactonase